MIDLKKLIEAGVHFGHQTSKWHPKMRAYIWGSRNKVHLINVAKTAFLLDRAEKFVESAAAEGKQVLFVGTKKSAQPIVRSIAEKLNMPYVSHRWIGGTLSNFDQVKKAVTRLLHLRDAQVKSTGRMTKKEQSMMGKEVERLEKNVGGITGMTGIPAAIVVVDAKKEHAVIREALGMNVPVVGIVDTNTDPSGVSFLIPANDDSPKSITLLLDSLSVAVEKGSKVAQENAANAAAQAAAERAARKKAADEKKGAEKEAAPAVPATAEGAADEKKVAAKPAFKKAPAAKGEKPAAKVKPKVEVKADA